MDELEILTFASAAEWNRWLGKNHARSAGIWLRLFKKTAGVASVSHAEALHTALRFGWIDGQLKPFDERSWLRRFTGRRARSIWSKRNRDLAEQLIAAGEMKPAGLREVEAAKADGRWRRAYDSPRKMAVPKDFLQHLSANQEAASFFRSLSNANTYAISWRLQTARTPATRQKRMAAIMEMLSRKQTFH